MRAMILKALPLALLLVGCGGWSVSSARRALELTAEATEASDRVIANAYRQKLDELEPRVEQGTITQEEFDEQVRVFNESEEIIASLRGRDRPSGDHGLLDVAERAIDAWQITGDDGGWLDVVPCIVLALSNLEAAADEAGIELPHVVYAIEFARTWLEGQCDRGVEPRPDL